MLDIIDKLTLENMKIEYLKRRLRGTVDRSIEGFDFFAFKGIPYAKPPIGELRFQDPLPVEPWVGIKEADKFGPMCIQSDPYITKSIQGDEDCLYLNIYVRSIDKNHRQPVMVWIHGGGFILGSGDDMFHGPDYLLKKDIVLVTINYRLGVLGFLNLEDEIAPGNQGLKDQILALEWIKSNIEYFGGDANNITIFGESAGGASVHLLALSPLAEGLFHKAIAQSGVALNPWAKVPNPKEYAYKLCALLGKNMYDSKAIVEFLKSIDSYKLIEAQKKLGTPQETIQFIFPFGPGVDAKSKNPFMPIPPEQAVVHMPLILGYNSNEGIETLIDENTSRELDEEDFNKIDKDFEKYLNPYSLETLKKHNLTSNDLKSLYCNKEKISKSNRNKFVELWGDLQFVEGIHSVAKIQAEKGSAPTYLYQFSYDKGFSFSKSKLEIPIEGASHFDEVPFLFRMKSIENLKVDPFKETEAHKIKDQMIELWVNFAKTGRPTPSTSELLPVYWKPVTNGTVLRYLNINENLQMEKTLNIEERLSFKK